MKKLFVRLFAEAAGTALLVSICCGAAVINNADLVSTALVFGITLFLLANIIGPISGCHINPAVTIAMIIRKKTKPEEGIYYMFAQFIGGIIGASFLFGLFSLVMSDPGLGANTVNMYNYVNDINNFAYAIIIEIFVTFVFVSAVLLTTNKKINPMSGAAIAGLALFLVHLFAINVTGTSVNPARSFGPALLSLFNTSKPILDFWVFLVGPMIGGALAGLANHYTDKLV